MRKLKPGYGPGHQLKNMYKDGIVDCENVAARSQLARNIYIISKLWRANVVITFLSL
jgi:hypothetical protein